jgi:hypothetical protein
MGSGDLTIGRFMTPQQAQEYIREYQVVLADESSRGKRRNPALLPTTKDNLLKAIKMEIAQLFFINSATEDRVQPLIRSAMFLDSFTQEALDTVTFVEDMQRRRDEIQQFHNELLNVKRDDGFFWQRVYALVGIDTSTKSQTFFDTIKTKFGLSSRRPVGETTMRSQQPAGRIAID